MQKIIERKRNLSKLGKVKDSCGNLINYDIDSRIITIKNFEGVFPINKLNHIPKGCGVINLDKSNQSGSHRVCYYKNLNFLEYFDSFGELNDIPQDNIKFLKKSNKVIKFNDSVLQKLDSSNCGCICICYIKQRSEGKKPLEVLNSVNQFPSNYNENKILKLS